MAAARVRYATMRIAFVAFGVALITILPAGLAAQGSACRPTDSVSTRLIASVLRYSGATSGDNAQVRTGLGLPLTSQVALVTSSTVCGKAKTAFATEFAAQGSNLSNQVYVVSVGTGNSTVYAVVDPGYRYNSVPREGLWPFVYFIDSKYKKLSIFAG
jgi:hypothetical protein